MQSFSRIFTKKIFENFLVIKIRILQKTERKIYLQSKSTAYCVQFIQHDLLGRLRKDRFQVLKFKDVKANWLLEKEKQPQPLQKNLNLRKSVFFCFFLLYSALFQRLVWANGGGGDHSPTTVSRSFVLLLTLNRNCSSFLLCDELG